MGFKLSSSFQIIGLFLSVLISACPAPTTTEVMIGNGSNLMQAGTGAIVLFPTHDGSATGKETEFISCLNKNLKKNISSNVKIIDTSQFQDHTFPWFEPNYAPTTIDGMNSLLSKNVVRERIASLGVQYLAVIALSSDDDVELPGIICGGGYGGAGCLGVYYDKKLTKVYAVIFDIVEGVRSVSLTTITEGNSYGFAFIVPVMFLAYTEADACKFLSDKLSQIIVTTTGAQ